ncbi:Phage XkdN-like protein [Desulfosporosinus orientis DSM 765]|uniref:Phage XkdN-like protein n=1 Tax=Desulfosporosinus orientis (strain ATCC 19365 / DSM 765 / NCIMB 8382 / VKM B-1628 / Singapore I) TaxID=768706 RepID=G7WEF2_DESOD|nr:phage portal protein [Desulfosporosinus orientis]AET70765.1 Phage XkdN-like protein [Desulfosporosinus orientis DSM 765]
MKDLQAFFANNARSDLNKEIVVSERFKGQDGKPMAWKIHSITEAENEEYRKGATRRIKGKNGTQQTEIDQNIYLAKIIVASVSFPDLKNAELQRSYGVMGAEELLRKMLFPGEYAALVQQVQEINGFDQGMEDLMDEVKN